MQLDPFGQHLMDLILLHYLHKITVSGGIALSFPVRLNRPCFGNSLFPRFFFRPLSEISLVCMLIYIFLRFMKSQVDKETLRK